MLGEGVQEFLQSLEAVWGEFYGTLHGVQQPTQNYFAGCPGSIPLSELLGGVGFLAAGAIRGCKRAEDSVDALKQGSACGSATIPVPLG